MQLNELVQLTVKEKVPIVAVLTVNEFTPNVVDEPAMAPTPKLLVDVPAVPDVAPVVVDDTGQPVTVTDRGDPWHTDTEPELPAKTGDPVLGVRPAFAGRSNTVTDTTVVLLGQAPLRHINV